MVINFRLRVIRGHYLVIGGQKLHQFLGWVLNDSVKVYFSANLNDMVMILNGDK